MSSAAHQGCRILGRFKDTPLLAHDCDATKGDSGSPILRQFGDEFRVIAMHVATVGKGQPPWAPPCRPVNSSSMRSERFAQLRDVRS